MRGQWSNLTIISLCRLVKSLGSRASDAEAMVGRLPKTADGVSMFVGDTIWRVNTRNAGKTWYVTQHKIKGIEDCNGDPCCSIIPDDYLDSRGWYSTTGHNRFFSTVDAAVAATKALTKEGL
jgi:hypothetical protein